MINTQLADASVLILSLISAWFLAGNFYRNRRTGLKKFPLFLIAFMGLWCILNMVAHLLAVLWVNAVRMQQGTFAYTFHFYALLLMGIVFLALSALQLHCVNQISRGNTHYRGQLHVYCLSLAFLSFPLFPLNPIGLLPVITSLSILFTVAATRKQWRSNKLQQTYRPRTAVTS